MAETSRYLLIVINFVTLVPEICTVMNKKLIVHLAGWNSRNVSWNLWTERRVAGEPSRLPRDANDGPVGGHRCHADLRPWPLLGGHRKFLDAPLRTRMT